MGETRVDLHHLLEDLRDAYPGTIEETILTEIVANALDSGARVIRLVSNSAAATLTVIDDGSGMRRAELRKYHDIAATTKTRGRGIGFAGVGIKLGLLVCEEVFTETRRGKAHVATSWRLSSKRRAPWNWLPPAGLIAEHGTAVRLRLQSALSPLLDSGYVEEVISRHFEPLLDPTFDQVLASHYPYGISFVVNGRLLLRGTRAADEKATVTVRLPRKRKPSALGFLVRYYRPLPESQRGVAISTFGKVIKRGWDWLGVSPAAPDTVGGLIEAPSLAESLTLNKADFIRAGKQGALYLAYRKAIQDVVSRQLADWGVGREGSERERRRAARPVERDLERILIDLADDFPLLATLVERRAGGQRNLPIGVVEEGTRQETLAAGPESGRRESPGPGPDGLVPREPGEQIEPPTPEAQAVPPGVLQAARKERKRPARYQLRIQFEQRPGDPSLSRLEQSTVWVNEAHPAYRRADASRSTGYHIALCTAMALARLAVEPAEAHDFVTAFLVRWGKTVDKKRRRRPRH
jgi:hypothetical protein